MPTGSSTLVGRIDRLADLRHPQRRWQVLVLLGSASFMTERHRRRPASTNPCLLVNRHTAADPIHLMRLFGITGGGGPRYADRAFGGVPRQGPHPGQGASPEILEVSADADFIDQS